jgi:D-arabinose 1-dehydrogenase-like Zn-dependent alcohol dehydrogenase
VKACGLCHSDSLCQTGFAKGYPRVPGHEIAGVIDAVGAGVTRFKTGDHVGVGWHGKHCHECRPCRQGDFICCEKLQITALHFDGGYQEYVNVPAEAVAKIPEGMDFKEAAPLMCAGNELFTWLSSWKIPLAFILPFSEGDLSRSSCFPCAFFQSPAVLVVTVTAPTNLSKSKRVYS